MPYIRGDVLYTDRLYDSESNLAYTPRAVTLNLRIGAQVDNYRFELFGTNITNNKTPTSLARAVQATAYGSLFGSKKGLRRTAPALSLTIRVGEEESSYREIVRSPPT